MLVTALFLGGSSTNADSNYEAAWTTTAGTQTQVATEGNVTTVADDKTGMTPDRKPVAADPEAEPPVAAVTTTEHPSVHLATYEIYAGTKNDAFATTTLMVVCNRTTGYKIAFTANTLSDGASHTIPAGSYSESTSGYNIVSIANDNSRSNVTLPSANATSGNVIVNQASDAAGDSFTATYGIDCSSRRNNIDKESIL